MFPDSREYMQASRTCQGVTKSGSPTPREMAPSISLTRSKNFLMPEGGMAFTTRFRWLSALQGTIFFRLCFCFMG